jgi:hypothetical protein
MESAAPRQAGVLAVTGFLITVHVLAGISVWLLSPFPLLAVPAALVYLLWCWFAARCTWLVGGLVGWWRRVLALLLWHAPALATGLWTVLEAFGSAPRSDLGISILQAWQQPVAPLWGMLPGVMVGGRGLYLWAASLLPWAIVIWLTVVALRNRAEPGR